MYSKLSYQNYRVAAICTWSSFESLPIFTFYYIQVPFQTSEMLEITKVPTAVLPKASAISPENKWRCNLCSYTHNEHYWQL